MSDPEFLSLEEVLMIHRKSLERWGGADGIRDERALASAIGMPESTFGGEYLHADLFAMAAAYAFHIAQAQAFIDGNKRTGAGCALVFLRMNGVRVIDPHLAIYGAMLAIADRRETKEGLAMLLRELSVRPCR